MDKYYVKTFQELNDMQSKTASLFKDLLVERYHYKLSSDKLKKNLEEASKEVSSLKRQNEKLQEGNEELKNLIYQCIKVFQYLDFSNANVVKNGKIILDTLKRILSQTNNVNAELTETDVRVDKEICVANESPAPRCMLNEDEIKKEIDAINHLKFSTQFYDSVELNKEKDNNQSDKVLERLFDRKYSEVTENLEKPVLVKETEPFYENNETALFGLEVQETLNRLSEVTTPKKNFILNSPVFKDFGNRRQENDSIEETQIDDSKRKIVNGNLFLKSSDLMLSPLKKSNADNIRSPKRDSPKRTKKKPKIDSPKRSPVNQLKKSNSREAEISISGIRKLTQTRLNIDCFKVKSPERRRSGENVENKEKAELIAPNDPNPLCEPDDDDVIMESPKKAEQVLDDIKNKKKPVFNSHDFVTPTTSADTDLDETYISASIVKKCQVTGKYILENVMEDETPVKRPNRERSPDCDSVPFVYKREAVRSKAERMKLPGHACLECHKYYKNALGDDASPRKLKEMLNKCSRHRDKYSPSHDDTPPGYWKPYLTASVRAYDKDDTITQ